MLKAFFKKNQRYIAYILNGNFSSIHDLLNEMCTDHECVFIVLQLTDFSQHQAREAMSENCPLGKNARKQKQNYNLLSVALVETEFPFCFQNRKLIVVFIFENNSVVSESENRLQNGFKLRFLHSFNCLNVKCSPQNIFNFYRKYWNKDMRKSCWCTFDNVCHLKELLLFVMVIVWIWVFYVEYFKQQWWYVSRFDNKGLNIYTN